MAYEPGVLRAEGYVGDELMAVEEVATTGKMASLEAKCFDSNAAVDKLIQIELSALDSEGRFVPDACPLISCEIEGPAHLVGMDAGDLMDLSLYSNPERKMFNGLLLAAIMPDGEGDVKVTFTTEDGMKAAMEFLIK